MSALEYDAQPSVGSTSQAAERNAIPWETLLLRLGPFVRKRVANRGDVDDVVQEVLLRMHRALPSLQQRERIEAWMYRIARNVIVDHARASASRRAMQEAYAAALESRESAWSDDQSVRACAPPLADGGPECSAAGYVAASVKRLPTRYRDAIGLVELRGRSQREAATVLGLSSSGVKSRVQRGRARLKAMLEACCKVAVDRRGALTSCEPRAAVAPTCCR